LNGLLTCVRGSPDRGCRGGAGGSDKGRDGVSNTNRCCTEAEQPRRIEDAILRLETELPHLATREMVAVVGTEIANVRTEVRTESGNIRKF